MGVYIGGGAAEADVLDEPRRQLSVDRARPLAFQFDKRLQSIVEAAAIHYRTIGSAISIINRDDQIFLARRGFDAWDTTRSASMCAIAIHRPGEVLVIPDATKDIRFSSYPTVTAAPFIRFYAGMPIVDVYGYPLGALCVFDPSPRHNEPDMRVLTAMARHVEQLVAA